MSLFEKIFKSKAAVELDETKVKLKEKEDELEKINKKEQATKNGEPYINVIEIDVSKDRPGIGSIELDWNIYFVEFLKKHGYEGRDDEQIIDRWFTDLCKNVVLETYEQYEANNPSYVTKRKIDDNRTEIG